MTPVSLRTTDAGRVGEPTGLSSPTEPRSTVSALTGFDPSRETVPAISMWQPYASLMFVWDRVRGEFAKANETRSHKLPDRLINEWIVIHATAKFAPPEFITSTLNDLCYDMFGCGYNYSLPRGAAIGRVRFGVPVPTGELAPFQPETEIAAGDWTPERWAWPVMEAELFAMPVPMKGAQGWWRCSASAIEARSGRRPMNNVTPIRPIPSDHMGEPYETCSQESECVEEMGNPLPGIGDAIAEFVTDPKFMTGFYVGTIFVCTAAYVVAF